MLQAHSSAAQRALCSSPMGANLPEADQIRLAQIATARQFDKGELLFSQGDPCTGFYLVIEGMVKVFRLSPEGREKVLVVVPPGQTFAEAALFGDGRFPAYAEAIAPSRLLFFPKGPFLRLLREDPDLSFKMLASMATWLKRMVGLIEELALQSAAGRFAHYLLSESGPSDKTVRLAMTKKDLAGRLGITPETLSRLLAELAGHQILQVKGRTITILDRVHLESVATAGKL
jgi:CRP/FNR family transcriptional regulator